jgi:hypothetical protein
VGHIFGVRRFARKEDRLAGKSDDERRELEAAGWEPEEREGETVWKNPASGLLYPQGQAVAIVREGADPAGPEPGIKD